MARNAHPEKTVQRILDVSQRLFNEKGYEKTTIQDIVDALDGLTKGAVYHHFKSKDEIIDALGTRMFYADNPFEAIASRHDLNGLEKVRTLLALQQENQQLQAFNIASVPLLKNPRYLAQQIDELRGVVAPQLSMLIAEGITDGSIASQDPILLAELLLVLLNLWLLPSLFPCAGGGEPKLRMIQSTLDALGFPVLDEATFTLCCKTIETYNISQETKE